jgi:hypothetical protein
MHLPPNPVSIDRHAPHRPRLTLSLVPTRDRYSPRAQRPLRGGSSRAHRGRAGERVKHFFDDLAVVDLAARDGEVQRTAFANQHSRLELPCHRRGVPVPNRYREPVHLSSAAEPLALGAAARLRPESDRGTRPFGWSLRQIAALYGLRTARRRDSIVDAMPVRRSAMPMSVRFGSAPVPSGYGWPRDSVNSTPTSDCNRNLCHGSDQPLIQAIVRRLTASDRQRGI